MDNCQNQMFALTNHFSLMQTMFLTAFQKQLVFEIGRMNEFSFDEFNSECSR